MNASERAAFLREVETALAQLIADAWARGWQPHELLRQARRKATKRGAMLATAALLIDHGSRATDAYHEHWRGQIEQLGQAVPADQQHWMRRLDLDGTPVALDDIESLVKAWSRLGSLPCLLPPPRGIEIRGPLELAPGITPSPVLDKVRALLAKAEATTYAAEAEAFTAKAHALMAQHTIDEAMVASAHRGRRAKGSPITIRLAIDDPYARQKSALAQWVAEANGCHACYHPSGSLSSIVGHPTDVAAVEIVYTSLLIQAQTAMNEAATHTTAHRHERSRGYRSAFLEAYAARVGERLREVNQHVREHALVEDDGRLLPELVRREEEVSDHFAALFPNLTTGRARRVDAAGWHAGHDAANRAALGSDAVAPAARPAVD